VTIGVIITVYNLQKYIAEAIQSVIDQSVQPDRILAINDGSTDASIEVIRRFKGQIEIIDNCTNLGVLPSIIHGMKLINTDVVCFLDGDDLWDKDKLKEVRDVFIQHEDAMLVTHSYQHMDMMGVVQSTKDSTHRNMARIVKQSNNDNKIADELLKTSILSYQGVWLGSALSIRSNFLDLDSFEKWSLGIWGHSLSHQDQPLAAFMILKNQNAKIYYVNKVLFHYRVFGENSSGSSSTLQKATHTLARSKATLLRTKNAVSLMKNRQMESICQAHEILELDYLELMYHHRLIKAFGIFFRLLIFHWGWRDRLKESMRLIGVLVFGVDRFLKIK
jgi:glycosyltransferase involved in cell wall biosynthesis